MPSKLMDNPKYAFAMAFLSWVDPMKSEIVPDDCQYLALLQSLENYPRRVASATIPDTLKNIFDHTEAWDAERIQAADNVLASHGAMTLSQAREAWPPKRRRS